MYCKKCGKVLLAGDKFCSSCGTKAEPQVPDRVEADFIPDFMRTEKATPEEKGESARPSFHLDEFNWDLNGYPTDNKKTEDIDFNWASVMDEKKKRNYESRVPLFRDPALKAAAAETERKAEPETESAEEPAPLEPAEEAAGEGIEPIKEDELFADMGALADVEPTRIIARRDSGRAAKVDKFYTFNKKNEELQALLEQEYERIKNGKRFEDDEDAEEPAETLEPEEAKPVTRIEFDWNAPVESEPEIVEVPLDAPQEASEEIVEDVPAEEVETEAEEAEEVPAVDEPAVESAEEVTADAQAGEEAIEEETATPKALVEEEKDEENERPEYICTVWAQTPAGVLAPELYEEADAIVEAAEAAAQQADVLQAEPGEAAEPAEDAEHKEETQDTEAPVTGAEEGQCPPSEEKEEKEKTKLAFDDVFGDDDDDADDEEKKGKGLKVLAVILCLLVALELGVIGIQYFAPDSAPGKMINNGYKYVLSLFSGEAPADAPADDEPAAEKSQMAELIEKHQDVNENIAAVEADESLTFEEGEDYGFLSDFAGSYNFSDKSWYTGDDGKTVTYGDEIVETLIGYYSTWVDKVNGKNDNVLDYIDNTTEYYIEIEGLEPEDGIEYGINLLKVGEIRAGSSGFYVLTSVDKVNSEDQKVKTEKQIVYMEPYEKTMKVIVVKKI